MIIKSIMRTIKDGGTTNTTTIVNGRIQRPDKSPDSDDSPGERSNGGGFYQVGKGNGNYLGGNGSDPMAAMLAGGIGDGEWSPCR